MLTDNINFLLKYDRPLRNELKAFEENHSIERIETRNGMFTLQVNQEDRKLLLHSKYDPLKEAERLIEQFAENISEYDHVFFYGIGLGYHVDAFLNKYPNLSFTLYEPNPYVFNHYLSVKKIEDLPIKNMKHLFVETSETKAKQFLTVFAENLKENSLLITLPSYERIFNEQFKKFASNFKESVKNKRSSFHVNVAFEKRWTINSIMNFPEVLKTPNILHDVNKEHFKNKPAIIVSAGPSLNEELDNLRYIKENGLAYIFAVGSANKTLIKNDIYPDAVCTYDPQSHNYKVYEELISKNIMDIPMIFGSSVGFETLQKFNGSKLHMLTSQDTIASFFLANKKDVELIYDAPSIAIVTFQLLVKLECNPIILVGQNLAYRSGQFYADGIKHEFPQNEIKGINNTLSVKSVDGGTVLTTDGFNRMRKELELYISQVKTNVINTTKGGANINGTKFIQLADVIKNCLTNKVVHSNWYEKIVNKYDIQFVNQQLVKMDQEIKIYQMLIEKISKSIERLKKISSENNDKIIEQELKNFDRVIKKLTSNAFFQHFIHPMIRTQFEIVKKKTDQIRFHKNVFEKANMTADNFKKFIVHCDEAYETIIMSYNDMKKRLKDVQGVSKT